jgi:uncharacterized protein
VKDGEAHLHACLVEMKRLNIVKGVVSGGDGDRLAVAAHWRETAPDRFIAAAGVRGSADTAAGDRRAAQGFCRGSAARARRGHRAVRRSHPQRQPYLALAEDFDVPVALHTGMGPPGVSYNPCCRGFRASLGNPLLIEDALNRHPKLRVNVMHGGWPYLEETIALLFAYPQVYTDVGAINWALPRAEFYAYLGALVRAGFVKRVMFGSDQMYWPEAIGMAVDAIDSATFLTPVEKRDVSMATRCVSSDCRPPNGTKRRPSGRITSTLKTRLRQL